MPKLQITGFVLVPWEKKARKENKGAPESKMLHIHASFVHSWFSIFHPGQFVIARVLRAELGWTNPWVYLLYSLSFVVASFYTAKLFFHLVERHFLNSPARP